MNEQLIDLDFLEELSGGDKTYKYELLGIFLTTVDEGLDNLGKLVEAAKDYEALFKQAHALKSSAGVVKVQGMYDHLLKIEHTGRAMAEGREEKNITDIKADFTDMMATYLQARPVLVEVREKNNPGT